jgi:hypothetical protein
VDDSQLPKLETSGEVASGHEFDSPDTAEARQHKARHSALKVAAALTAVGAVFVMPGLAQNRIEQGTSSSWGGSTTPGTEIFHGGGGGGGGGGSTAGSGSFSTTVSTSPSASSPPCGDTSGSSSLTSPSSYVSIH